MSVSHPSFTDLFGASDLLNPNRYLSGTGYILDPSHPLTPWVQMYLIPCEGGWYDVKTQKLVSTISAGDPTFVLFQGRPCIYYDGNDSHTVGNVSVNDRVTAITCFSTEVTPGVRDRMWGNHDGFELTIDSALNLEQQPFQTAGFDASISATNTWYTSIITGQDTTLSGNIAGYLSPRISTTSTATTSAALSGTMYIGDSRAKAEYIQGHVAKLVFLDIDVTETQAWDLIDDVNQMLKAGDAHIIPIPVAAGGATGKSNPMYGPLGGPLVGVM